MLDECDDDTIVIVMSDHGFGPMSNVRLRMNQILRDAGLLKFRRAQTRGMVTQKLAGWLDKVLRSTLSSDVKRTIAGLFPRLRVWFENLDEAKIDWNQTAAYVNEAYRSSPAIWLNRLRWPTSDGEGAELRQRVEKAIASLIDPMTGGA